MPRKSTKQFLSRIKKRVGLKVFNVNGPQLMFSNGLALVALGILAVVFPRLLIVTVALFFVFLGILMCIVALKLVRFQRRFAETVRKLEARVYVHGAKGQELFGELSQPEVEESQPRNRKIVMH